VYNVPTLTANIFASATNITINKKKIGGMRLCSILMMRRLWSNHIISDFDGFIDFFFSVESESDLNLPIQFTPTGVHKIRPTYYSPEVSWHFRLCVYGEVKKT
jgi:hypothetical protein